MGDSNPEALAALGAARVASARARHCEPAPSSATSKPLRDFGNKWIDLLLPADAARYAFESDDVFDKRPKWSGENWSAHVVVGGADLVEFTESTRLCNLSDDNVERNVFIGEWIGRYGAYGVLSRRGADKPDLHVIVDVSIEPHGLSEAQALRIIASARVPWSSLGEP